MSMRKNGDAEERLRRSHEYPTRSLLIHCRASFPPVLSKLRRTILVLPLPRLLEVSLPAGFHMREPLAARWWQGHGV